jgi:hypothetical protein
MTSKGPMLVRATLGSVGEKQSYLCDQCAFLGIYLTKFTNSEKNAEFLNSTEISRNQGSQTVTRGIPRLRRYQALLEASQMR